MFFKSYKFEKYENLSKVSTWRKKKVVVSAITHLYLSIILKSKTIVQSWRSARGPSHEVYGPDLFEITLLGGLRIPNWRTEWPVSYRQRDTAATTRGRE